ncbi:glycosyltransferase [Cellulophaga lytica]|uniref:glycosyltransferase n=1 Tax=Cellulophaga lytica TaxID=979 RepID=UPI00349F98A7
MINICFLNSTKTWGGGEKWHYEASTYMHKNGHNVIVVTNNKSALFQKITKTDIPCINLKINNLSFLNPIKINKLSRILKENKIDCIVINISEDLKLGGLAAKKAGVKRIIYRRGSASAIKNSLLNRFYFKNIITDVLTNSEATKLSVLENNKKLFPKDSIKIIYNAIDCSSNIIEKSKTSETVYYKRASDEVILTSLGRLEYEKNHQFLIYLSKELKNRNIKHKILIGGEGSLKENLIKLSKQLNVQDEVKFLGFIDDSKKFLMTGDIFVHPSLWEGFGYVLAEASLCYKPVIAFNTTSIPEIIINNKSGYVVELNNIKKVANKVQLLASNSKLRNDLGRFGFEYINSNFNNSFIYNQMEEYLAPDNKTNKISALLITYNEENNICDIIENLSFAHEIIVIDSFSTDKTEELAKKYKHITFIKREFKNYTDQKSYALSLAKNNWILFLDADERISSPLKNEIISTVNIPFPSAAYFMYRIFMYEGKKINFSGTQRDKNYRLFQKSKVKFDPDLIVHETLLVNGSVGILKNKLLHYSYDSYKAYKVKMLRYGKMKAQEDFAKNKKATPFHLYLKPIGKFIEHYIIKLGVLDGIKGMIICYLYALSTRKRYTYLKQLHNGEQK